MRPIVWPALVGAPLLALAQQATSYAMVPWACQSGQGGWLVALPLPFAAATLGLTLLAARVRPQRFLARVAVGSGALASIAVVALAIPTWWLSPCAA
jgi:hypothetical protein